MSTATPTEKLSPAEREALEVADDPVLAHMLAEERIESEEVDTRLLLRLLSYVRPHRKIAAAAVGLAILEALVMTLPAFLIGLAIDQVRQPEARSLGLFEGGAHFFAERFGQPGEEATWMIYFFGGLVMMAFALRWIIAVATTYLVQMLGQRVVHDLRRQVYTHITGMDMGFFHSNPVGRLVNRTTFDTQAISELFSDAFAHGLRDIIFIIVLFVVMFALDAPMALVLLGAFPFLVVIALLYRHFGRPAMRTNQAVQSRMNAWLAENISGMRENHLYRTQDRRRAEFRNLTQAHQRSITRVIRSWGLLRPFMLLTSAVATSAILGLGYERVTTGAVTVGVLLTFLQYTTKLWRPVRNLTEKYNLIQTSLTAGERIMDVLDTPSAMVDAPDVDPSLCVEEGAIEFAHVTFQYPSKDEPALRDVSFSVEPGQMLALVGDTGAGKSTIAHLLSRFYDATEGRVLIDGREVSDYPLHALRSGLAIVPQDVVIFAGTLRDNITLGAEVDDATILEAVRAVCAESLVERFDHGLDHVMAEGGRTLSTGERQLLSFARALVASPPVLVLDEATANVDTQTEAIIQEALARLTAGRTSVVIAHRLSTVRDADLILVLRHGRVIESGRHAELLETGGEYARLYALHHGSGPSPG